MCAPFIVSFLETLTSYLLFCLCLKRFEVLFLGHYWLLNRTHKVSNAVTFPLLSSLPFFSHQTSAVRPEHSQCHYWLPFGPVYTQDHQQPNARTHAEGFLTLSLLFLLL